jgi:hypothetical protein
MSEKLSDQSQTQSPPNNPLQKFLSDEQDPAAVRQAHSKVSQILTRDEKISYIAVQKSLINLSPDCAVLTNRRFIIYKPKLLGGASFQDYIWRNLRDVHLNEGMIRSTVTLKTVKGQILTLGDLPKSQARKLYAFAQEMEEKVLEERRQRAMEEKRAAAGGIMFQGNVPATQTSTPVSAPVAPQEDPIQKLKQLKDMLDMELISAQEYETKKSDILSKM